MSLTTAHLSDGDSEDSKKKVKSEEHVIGVHGYMITILGQHAVYCNFLHSTQLLHRAA